MNQIREPDELDNLAVYHAAQRARKLKQLERDKEAKKKREYGVVRVIFVLIVAVIILWTFAMGLSAATDQGEIPATAVLITPVTPLEPWTVEGEDPQETEKIEAALLAQGYLSDAVPLSYDLQDIMRTACAEYACPYPLALAVAETESLFDMDAVGAAGEVGIMQLNPGPGGAYHAELMAATGQDPTTPAGNIVCGVYLLGKYLETYGDAAKAIMAYNMGESGAKNVWAAGVASTDYTKAVLAAMENWECTVNA